MHRDIRRESAEDAGMAIWKEEHGQRQEEQKAQCDSMEKPSPTAAGGRAAVRRSAFGQGTGTTAPYSDHEDRIGYGSPAST